MKGLGFFCLIFAAYSLYAAIFISKYWFIGFVFTAFYSWEFLSSYQFEKTCNAITKGRVLDIKPNGKFIGGRHQPLYNSEIAYLDRVKTFKNLPPNFIHSVSSGDIIEIKYNTKKPHIAFVNFIE